MDKIIKKKADLPFMSREEVQAYRRKLIEKGLIIPKEEVEKRKKEESNGKKTHSFRTNLN
jgi:hypothetical protein